MFQPRGPFESEKIQLQELNQRLSQYLSRAKFLEQENDRLIKEIHTIRQNRSREWENKHLTELREMRRLVQQLSFEKNKAEMDREKLRKEFKMIQAMRSDESAVNKGIDGELKGCERQLHHAYQTNNTLEERLIQLENEYESLENAHRKEIGHLRNQVHDRVLPVVTQSYHGPPAVSTDEVQEYALNLTESWVDTLEMYRQRVEEIEESIKEDQTRLEDIRREKIHYASELNRLRAELEKQSRIQMDLEEQFMNMQDNFRGDVSQYQMIIEELEHERSLLSNTISEKLKEHQDLLQVKMGLGLELAAYRALLEEEGRLRDNRHSRERIIDIKLPAQPYTPRTSSMTASRPEMRRHFTGFDIGYMEPISSLRTSTVSSQFDSHGASRIVPITVSSQAQRSPAARRDMISFTKATQAAATKSVSKPGGVARGRKKEVLEETSVEIIGNSKDPARTHLTRSETGDKPGSIASQTAELKSVRVVSPPMMSLSTTEERPQEVVDMKNKKKDERIEIGPAKATVKPIETQFVQQESKHDDQRDFKVPGKVEPKVYEGEEKILDSVSMEEIIEKVMKPAGLDTKLGSSADSKITYHVEKTEQEDGSTKTQIVLQAKVEEDVSLSDDSAFKEFLSKGVKKVSLEDIEGTPTGSMIHNLLSLGLQGESLDNKSVNVEIIEEPVESDEDVEIEETVEVTSKPYFKASPTFFRVEESENELQTAKQHESTDETMKASGHGLSGTVHVQEVSRDESLPYYSHGQETQEYFVSTPEDNMSESEEGGFMSYGHYGVVEDLSDERYYQEEVLPTNRRYSDEGDSNRESLVYVESDTFPECIIEEEVHVSPVVQESMLEILKEESLDPREQLKGALEHLEATVSGSLKEELALFTKAGECADNVSIDIKKVERASDSGTTTIVAQVNVSQSLEESGLLDDMGDDLNQEQVMAALRSSHPGLHQAVTAGAEGGYKMRVTKTEFQTQDMPWMTSPKETEDWSLASEVGKTEKIIRLEPNERSFTFQMDINKSSSEPPSTGGADSGGYREDGNSEFLPAQMTHPSLTDTHEKRVATIYLESSKEE